MSHYSTGELAKLAGVTVRTVQYYDKRGLLVPSDVTEGGRRLYTEEDLHLLEIICFLRDLDFSIEQIKSVLAEDNSQQVLEILLEMQVKTMKEQIKEQESKLDIAVKVLGRIRGQENQNLEYLRDISLIMKHQTAYRRFRLVSWGLLILSVVLFLAVIFLVSLLPDSSLKMTSVFVLAAVYTIGLFICIYRYYKRISYLCPACHQVFRPGFGEFSLAAHTPSTRKLTCPHCQVKSYCAEVLDEK